MICVLYPDMVIFEISPLEVGKLEFGIIPARYVRKKVMDLKHILMQNENKIMKKVFNAQVRSPFEIFKK